MMIQRTDITYWPMVAALVRSTYEGRLDYLAWRHRRATAHAWWMVGLIGLLLLVSFCRAGGEAPIAFVLALWLGFRLSQISYALNIVRLALEPASRSEIRT